MEPSNCINGIYKQFLRIPALLKSLWLPLLVSGSVLIVVTFLWWLQQQNVRSFGSQIVALQGKIDALQKTVAQKNQLNQQLVALKQQINTLPDKVASKKLNQRLAVLEQQIGTLPDQVASTDQIALEKDRLILEKDRVNAQNAIFGWLVQAVGGAFFFVTAYFTWRNVKATEEKQVTERFSKAVELLGNEKLEVRLGGIYALERIANDSGKDYWPVIEVLTAYVREKAPYPPIKKNEGVPFWLHNTEPVEEQEEGILPVPTDIQAVLTVLARRRSSFGDGEELRLYLRKTNLQEADFRGANLRGADFLGANLRGADIRGADLQGAFFLLADLRRAQLVGADLRGAQLVGAKLQEADIRGAKLQEADIGGAKLQGVIRGDDNLPTSESSQP